MPKLKERPTEQDKLYKAYQQIVGGKLAAERETVADLAALLHISESTVYRKNKHPETYTLGELKAIAKRYKFSPSECALLLGVL